METNKKYLTKGRDTTWQGVPCSSDDARKWDELQKQLEKEELGYKRATVYKAESFDEDEWADVSIVNDLSLDRDSEVVEPKGADLTFYNKNPVMTLNHNYEDLPVGRAAWLKFEPNKRTAERIKMKAIYPRRPKDYPAEAMWKPEEVFGLIRQGFLNGKSVGFIGLEAREPSQKEIDKRPDLQHCRRIISKWQLLEVAVCSIPCNPAALVAAHAKGLVEKKIVDALGIPVDLTQAEEKDLWLFDTKQEQPKEQLPRFYRKWQQTEIDLSNYITSDEIVARLTGKP